jgi:hypothetical protein
MIGLCDGRIVPCHHRNNRRNIRKIGGDAALGEVAERLMGDVPPSKTALHDAATVQLAALIRGGQA